MNSLGDLSVGLPQEWEESYQRMMRGCGAIPNGDPKKLHQALQRISTGAVDFNALPGPTGVNKRISVPLQKLDKCHVCAKTSGLRLCNSCASAIYCGKDCQKIDWREHKQFCSQTQQINLKVFHPFIAYLFDTLRRIIPDSAKSLPPNLDPFLLSMFEKLGRRPGTRPISFHPALCHKLLKAPTPGSRKSTASENTLHHTVILGDSYELDISRFPDPDKLTGWLRGKRRPEAIRMYRHIVRETDILEVTVAVSLLLLSEVYSTHMTKPPPRSDAPSPAAGEEQAWELRPCYRLEYGYSPVSDFGICKGRILGKSNRLQTWTYHNRQSDNRVAFLDPDNHYWMYFRTIKGEEIVLDCCSAAYGMEACVDASGCLRNLPAMFRDYGSSRTPAYFYQAKEGQEQVRSHVLVEEKRFSVMQNTNLHGALSWEIFGGGRNNSEQHARVREFVQTIQGRPCTEAQEERIQDFRSHGGLMLNQVLEGRHWKEWKKPEVFGRGGEDVLTEETFVRGSKGDKDCNGRLNGMMGLFGEAFGMN